jgi:hypothetical protein
MSARPNRREVWTRQDLNRLRPKVRKLRSLMFDRYLPPVRHSVAMQRQRRHR